MAQKRSVSMYAGHVVRIGCPLAIFALCMWALAPHIADQSLDGIVARLRSIPWPAWLAAVSLTIISLLSVGRYDGVAHRHFATGIADHQARWSGTISISLSQTLGFGLLTGAIARWRILPNITMTTALKLSTFVSLSFILSWAVVLAIACTVLPAPTWIKPLAFTILAIVLPVLWLMFRHPNLRIGGVTLRLPSLLSTGAIIMWTAIDTIAAGAVLFVLLPPDAAINFAQFLPLFLIALGTALLSNTPGGVGPFELMMIGLIPQLLVSDVLVSILAFRIVYYAVPAILGTCALIFPFASSPQPSHQHTPTNLRQARNAELGIIFQNGGRTLATRDGACAIWPTGQTLTVLCDPIKGTADASLTAVCLAAKSSGRIPMAYKCSGKTAMAARKRGWSILHISDDALIDPLDYAPLGPSARRLRRKLRCAEKSGVTIQSCGSVPWSELAEIDTAWQTTHGTARGGTMGRFEQGYLSDHLIVRGYLKDRLVAFVSFQRSSQEWCLDLIRHSTAAPDGTMHALVHHAILCAQYTTIKRVNLAAVPACPDPASPLFRWAARVAISAAGGTGLRQFKSAFSPRWSARYAAAPNPIALALGLADIAREVHCPAPIVVTAPQIPDKIHNNNENYVLAS